MSTAGPVTVRCQGCGHTLGTLRATGTGRGWEADWTGARATHGAMAAGAGPACLNGRTDITGRDDWNTIVCQRCHRTWQGPDDYLHDLAAAARDGDVRLGQSAPTGTGT